MLPLVTQLFRGSYTPLNCQSCSYHCASGWWLPSTFSSSRVSSCSWQKLISWYIPRNLWIYSTLFFGIVTCWWWWHFELLDIVGSIEHCWTYSILLDLLNIAWVIDPLVGEPVVTPGPLNIAWKVTHQRMVPMVTPWPIKHCLSSNPLAGGPLVTPGPIEHC